MNLKHVSQIDGIRINQIKSIFDERGTFFKIYPLHELKESLNSIVLSVNPVVGTVRGLHFQVEPFAEEKLITCIQGSVFDVFVDLRPKSKTLGRWASFELSATSAKQIYLPKGIAHGFQTLVPNSILHYSLSSMYSSESSYTINPFGNLGIEWPLKVTAVSERDIQGISFANAAQAYTESLDFGL